MPSIVDQFHQLYYYAAERHLTWSDTRWLGVRTLKCPLDLWIYQEILHEVRPRLIIETGTYEGGSALFFASICDLLGTGDVVSIDVEHREDRPKHPRISYVLGSSTDPEIVKRVEEKAGDRAPIVVILDAAHQRDHVLKELETWSRFVGKGSYLIVEDTCVNGHPVAPDHGPGPMEAVEDFLKRRKDFAVDESREKFLLTFNPRGYLRRIS